MSSLSNSWGLIGGLTLAAGAFTFFLNFDFDSLAQSDTPHVTKEQVTEILHEVGQAVLREMVGDVHLPLC